MSTVLLSAAFHGEGFPAWGREQGEGRDAVSTVAKVELGDERFL